MANQQLSRRCNSLQFPRNVMRVWRTIKVKKYTNVKIICQKGGKNHSPRCSSQKLFFHLANTVVHYSLLVDINRHNLFKTQSLTIWFFTRKKKNFLNFSLIVRCSAGWQTYATPHSGFLVAAFGGKQLRPGWRQCYIHTPTRLNKNTQISKFYNTRDKHDS